MSSVAQQYWESDAGLKELDRVATERLHFDLRDWQRKGAAWLLSGVDVLLLVATGSGKSSYKKNIVGTFTYQLQKVSTLEKKGFKDVALNADMISAFEEAGRDVWKECAQGEYQIILCSPEQLSSGEMVALLTLESFKRRVGLVVVDEVHLIPTWGTEESAETRSIPSEAG
ncbi:hypothetical protein FRC10_000787 [Ceratobasidium sp. 414]|nr:hypothetical protein FRC10_000787 [Ceratobasidium sp. 414]